MGEVRNEAKVEMEGDEEAIRNRRKAAIGLPQFVLAFQDKPKIGRGQRDQPGRCLH